MHIQVRVYPWRAGCPPARRLTISVAPISLPPTIAEPVLTPLLCCVQAGQCGNQVGPLTPRHRAGQPVTCLDYLALNMFSPHCSR